MNNEIYKRVKEFKRKYPLTVAFRLKAHAKVVSKFIGDDEKVKYVFAAQKIIIVMRLLILTLLFLLIRD